MSELNLPPFYFGQKLVCIKGYEDFNISQTGFDIKSFPITNGVYTFRGYDSKALGGKYAGIYLNEFTNPKGYDGVEISYAIHRFDPIEESFQVITYEKVMEQESELINTN